MAEPLNIVVLGLSITSAWGNGHATVYRALVRALVRRSHRVLFLERDKPWYAQNRDLPHPPYGRAELYSSLADLQSRFAEPVADADLVMIGSFVPDGVPLTHWILDRSQGVTAFYDIDTPVTLAKLDRKDFEYLHPDLIPRLDLYLSFTGGPVLARIEQSYGSPRARPLYCCFDPDVHYPQAAEPRWDLGYMGAYSPDRQPRLQRLLLDPAARWPSGQFVVAGPQYPADLSWPANVQRIEHLPPSDHRLFYNRQRFTLNLTRADMAATGYCPSVRLFEAAACGTAIITDTWPGLDEFFEPGRDVLTAESSDELLNILRQTPDDQRLTTGLRARHRVLTAHTASHRAGELEQYVAEVRQDRRAAACRSRRRVPSAETQRAIQQLGPWFHNLHLPDGSLTAPNHFRGDYPSDKWRQIADHLPQNMEGWDVLDVGCNAGFYCVDLAKRGANVLGVDRDERSLAQAHWVVQQFGLEDRVTLRRLQVYDLARFPQQFDLVLFMGVFYHLRYPLLGLDLVAQKVRHLLIFQTMTMPGNEVYGNTADLPLHQREPLLEPGWPKMAFIEHRLAGDPTNWWAPNHAAVTAMLRSAGLDVIGQPGHEIYLCQPDPSGPHWDPAQLLSATGQSDELANPQPTATPAGLAAAASR